MRQKIGLKGVVAASNDEREANLIRVVNESDIPEEWKDKWWLEKLSKYINKDKLMDLYGSSDEDEADEADEEEDDGEDNSDSIDDELREQEEDDDEDVDY